MWRNIWLKYVNTLYTLLGIQNIANSLTFIFRISEYVSSRLVLCDLYHVEVHSLYT